VKPQITRAGVSAKVPPPWINLAGVFEAALHLLHPFMPFITEELWQRLPHAASRRGSISLTPFTLVNERAADPVSEKQFGLIQELIVSLRNAKAEMGLQKVKPSAQVACEDLRWLELIRLHLETVLRLSAFQALTFTRERLEAAAPGARVGQTFDLRVFQEKPADRDAERSRLRREKEKLGRALTQVKAQLENREFLERAPREVVRAAEQRRAELDDHLRKILDSLERQTDDRPL